MLRRWVLTQAPQDFDDVTPYVIQVADVDAAKGISLDTQMRVRGLRWPTPNWRVNAEVYVFVNTTTHEEISINFYHGVPHSIRLSTHVNPLVIASADSSLDDWYVSFRNTVRTIGMHTLEMNA